uniref:DUF1618 domain-containing protein n=1 Tax=Oryza punctata TaxID=4537 RepID=A0A0E0LP43_ORYPU
MVKIGLPSTSFNLRAPGQRIHCFPAADRRVFSLDQSGRALLLDSESRRLVMLPRLHKPKLEPIALYIPCPELDLDGSSGGSGGGNLYIMDRIVKPEAGCRAPVEQSNHFEVEALIYSKYSPVILCKSWECELLPPLPLNVRDDTTFLEVSSYAVIKGDSQICISIDGVGTYCLDTASNVWSEVGKWTLPFQGKVDYVPELKLWFGFSAEDGRLAAANLSGVGSLESQPKLLYSWMELEPPQEWKQIQDPQLVNLGSGRFCIARFFHTRAPNGDFDDESGGQNVTVLTGVEFAKVFDGISLNLGLVKYKSRCHKASCGEDTITAVL